MTDDKITFPAFHSRNSDVRAPSPNHQPRSSFLCTLPVTARRTLSFPDRWPGAHAARKNYVVFSKTRSLDVLFMYVGAGSVAWTPATRCHIDGDRRVNGRPSSRCLIFTPGGVERNARPAFAFELSKYLVSLGIWIVWRRLYLVSTKSCGIRMSRLFGFMWSYNQSGVSQFLSREEATSWLIRTYGAEYEIQEKKVPILNFKGNLAHRYSTGGTWMDIKDTNSI